MVVFTAGPQPNSPPIFLRPCAPICSTPCATLSCCETAVKTMLEFSIKCSILSLFLRNYQDTQLYSETKCIARQVQLHFNRIFSVVAVCDLNRARRYGAGYCASRKGNCKWHKDFKAKCRWVPLPRSQSCSFTCRHGWVPVLGVLGFHVYGLLHTFRAGLSHVLR